LETYSEEKAAALFARFVKNGTWQVPTLTVLRAMASLDEPAFTNDARLKYMSPFVRRLWDPKNDFRLKNLTKEDYAFRKVQLKKQYDVVAAMHKAHVKILAGTDVMNPYCFPGFSLHDELELLVRECRFTPLEAIQSATREPAEYLGRSGDLGTVEVGKLADLVLLNADPLVDIRNTTKIDSVVINGQLLRRTKLNGMLAKVEAAWKERPKTAPVAGSDVKEWTPKAMMQVKSISAVQASPDGKEVVYAVRRAVMDGEKSEYRSQLFVSRADGGDSYALTQEETSSEAPRWSPDGQWIAFASNRSGVRNVWVIRAHGGEAKRLTDVKGGVQEFAWSPDGKALAFTAVEADTAEEEKSKKEKSYVVEVGAHYKMSRLYVIAVNKEGATKPEARALTPGDYHVASGDGVGGAIDWSPDGKTIAFCHVPSPRADDWTRADISLVAVADAKVRSLVRSAAAETSPKYSPDGRWIAFVKSDEPATWGGDRTIQVIAADGGAARRLAATYNHDPSVVGWSKDGAAIYYTEAYGTVTRLCAMPLSGSPRVLSQDEGVVQHVSLNAGGTVFGFSRESMNRAPEAYVSRLDAAEPTAVSSVNGDLPSALLADTDVLRWKAADGREIEGLLTYPVNYDVKKRYPLLLVIHGGPAGLFSQRYIAAPSTYPVAAFSARGYLVLRCNPRGSTGYGKDFRYANYKDWGGGDFRDLMAGVDRLIEDKMADPERLGVMGWSYGGFMTSWTITQTKRFKAASVGAGVTNLMSFTGTADIPSFLPDYFGAEPWDDLDTYRKHSAMFNVKGVTTPTLIQHGEKDERVPISQGYELYNALKRQGCPVEMVVYPRTPHGPQEPKLLLDVMERNVRWFEKYVRP
jgi:dipeptidyl aminopeptidase/acylaminoacyl peptidase